jgi:hypothetical protein
MLVNALLRYLLCISPWRAENVFYASHVAPPLRQGWTRVVTGDHESWILVDSRGGTGQWRPAPPEGVPAESIPTVETPPAYRIGLRRMAATLVAQAGGDAAYPHLAGLFDRLLSMGNGRFEAAELERFVALCAQPGWLPEGIAAYRADLLAGACDSRFPGYFVGLMMLFLDAIQGARAVILSGMLLDPRARSHLHALLDGVFRQLLDNDGPASIEQAAKGLRRKGKELLATAARQQRDEDFYGNVFRSCAFFYGANRGFDWLASSVQDPAESARFRRAADETEEFLVYTSSSLLHHFGNLKFGWAGWQQHVRHVADVRRELGAAAAEREVTYYLQTAFYYPACYREALLAGGKPPPETIGTAGGATIGQLCGACAP